MYPNQSYILIDSYIHNGNKYYPFYKWLWGS